MPNIECRIRRANGTEIDLPNSDGGDTRYHFKPLDPSRVDSPHVAEVSTAHADLLTKVAPDCYVPFDAPKAAAPVSRPAAAAPSPAPAQETPAAAADTNDNGVLSVAEFNKAHAAGKFDALALRELLAKEEESETPRSSFIAAVTKALK